MIKFFRRYMQGMYVDVNNEVGEVLEQIEAHTERLKE